MFAEHHYFPLPLPAQYPENAYCKTDISIEEIKATCAPQDNIRHCLAWTTGNKKGRPKKGTRMKGIMDHIKDSGRKRKRKVKMFCKHCQKFNHTTEQCFLLKKPWTQLDTIQDGGLGGNDGQEGSA